VKRCSLKFDFVWPLSLVSSVSLVVDSQSQVLLDSIREYQELLANVESIYPSLFSFVLPSFRLIVFP